MCLYIYLYIYIYILCIYIARGREREREKERERERLTFPFLPQTPTTFSRRRRRNFFFNCFFEEEEGSLLLLTWAREKATHTQTFPLSYSWLTSSFPLLKEEVSQENCIETHIHTLSPSHTHTHILSRVGEEVATGDSDANINHPLIDLCTHLPRRSANSRTHSYLT